MQLMNIKTKIIDIFNKLKQVIPVFKRDSQLTIEDIRQKELMERGDLLINIIIKDYIISFSAKVAKPNVFIDKIKKSLLKYQKHVLQQESHILPFRMYYDQRCNVLTYQCNRIYNKEMVVKLISEIGTLIDDVSFLQMNDSLTSLLVTLPETSEHVEVINDQRVPSTFELKFKSGEQEICKKMVSFRGDTDKIIILNFILMALYAGDHKQNYRNELGQFDIPAEYHNLFMDYVTDRLGRVSEVTGEYEGVPVFNIPRSALSAFNIRQCRRGGNFLYVSKNTQTQLGGVI